MSYFKYVKYVHEFVPDKLYLCVNKQAMSMEEKKINIIFILL